MSENEYEYVDVGAIMDETDVENPQAGLQEIQAKALTEFNEYLASDEFQKLGEFERIKAMMERLGSPINDPKPNCKKCQ